MPVQRSIDRDAELTRPILFPVEQMCDVRAMPGKRTEDGAGGCDGSSSTKETQRLSPFLVAANKALGDYEVISPLSPPEDLTANQSLAWYLSCMLHTA